MAKAVILVVDDDPGVLGFVCESVIYLGYSAQTANNAAEALELLGGGGFDAVLTDIEMPEMSGVELAREIRTRWPHLPVMLMTGSGDPRGSADAALLLRKPFTLEMLRGAFAQMLPAPS